MRRFAWVVGFVVLTTLLGMARWSPPPDPLIADAQRFLHRQQLYVGAVNGLYDRDTAAAIRRFQMLNEMQATGRLDSRTASRMQLPEYTPAPAIVQEDREFLRSLERPPPVAEEIRPPLRMPELKNFPLQNGKDGPGPTPKGGEFRTR